LKREGQNSEVQHQLNHSLKKICCKFYLSIGQPLPDNLQDFTFEQENQEAASNYRFFITLAIVYSTLLND
jgi:aspartate racemase